MGVTEPSLSQLLADAGYTHRRAGSGSNGDHDIRNAAGAVVFTGPAHKTWEWLQAQPSYHLRKQPPGRPSSERVGRNTMKLKIEIECDNAAFCSDDHPYESLHDEVVHVLEQASRKLPELWALAASTLPLLDSNGNTVGTVCLTQD